MNDKKHGYGISYDLINNSFIIANWDSGNIEGIAIYFAKEKEQIWEMEKNKIKRKITNDNEVRDIKTKDEYKKLQDFYELIYNK
jgi:hypothetical protein